LFLFDSSGQVAIDNSYITKIAEKFLNLNPVIVRTKVFLPAQKNNPGITLWDLSKKINNSLPFIKAYYAGVISKWINESENSVVAGNEDDFFFKVLFRLRNKQTKIVVYEEESLFPELTELLKNNMEAVFNSEYLEQRAKDFLKNRITDNQLLNHLHVIAPPFAIPPKPVIYRNEQLECIYFGSELPAQRASLLESTAKKMLQKPIAVHFSIIGKVDYVIDKTGLTNCTFYGDIRDPEKLKAIISKADTLMITSKTGNIPRGLLEMFAMGKPVISTTVGAVPDYIKDGVNGYLIPENKIESKMMEDYIIALSIIGADRITLIEIAQRNHKKANELLNEQLFIKKWKEIIPPY